MLRKPVDFGGWRGGREDSGQCGDLPSFQPVLLPSPPSQGNKVGSPGLAGGDQPGPLRGAEPGGAADQGVLGAGQLQQGDGQVEAS